MPKTAVFGHMDEVLRDARKIVLRRWPGFHPAFVARTCGACEVYRLRGWLQHHFPDKAWGGASVFRLALDLEEYTGRVRHFPPYRETER